MSFKENLKQKIEIDRMARRALDSLEPGEDGVRIDKEAVRGLLETAGYESRVERDMELFSRDFTADPPEIIVLDNELPLFRTMLSDVVLRRNPFLKEMLSIRNAIRILNDKDVVRARRADTVMKLHGRCVMQLDLRYNRADIESIQEDGATALEANQPEAAAEALTLFAELLDLHLAPAASKLQGFLILGRRTTDEAGSPAFGNPLIIYNQGEGALGLLETAVSGAHKPKPAVLRDFLSNHPEFSLEGKAVLERLKTEILENPPVHKSIDSLSR
ncbi:MAG: hypothetical protein K9K62_09235 [Desulfobacteraceae bacterium]|nr:hypothetical protein [Desulfobacteraceae bacterium]